MSPGAHDVLGEGDPINGKCVHCAMACVCCEVLMVCINFVGSQSQSKWKGECICMLYVHTHVCAHTHTHECMYAYVILFVVPDIHLCQLAELVWLQSDCSVQVV